jgi:hypothetical protein
MKMKKQCEILTLFFRIRQATNIESNALRRSPTFAEVFYLKNVIAL